MKTYLFSYRYDGREFSVDVPADTLEEAKGRVRVMSLARYDGELVARIPVPGTGWLTKLLQLWR